MSTPQALALIPARYASTRLPGKPLLADTGKPLIQHVVEQVQRATSVDRIAVATDDDRIAEAVRAFGGEAVMTGEHPNGTSRLAEALTSLGTDHELIVNVQGDEPEIEPAVIDALVAGLAADPDAPMATLCSAFAPDEDPTDPNIVKVVSDRHRRALYFSRACIPFDRDGIHPTVWKHPGLYAYRRGFLLDYPNLTPTPLEQAEQLEQLRVLEHGHRIALIAADAPHPGIDTRAQYDAFVARSRAQN
ncbi:MAG: 3-deoxy-manno-octulosonate cytidylyltransferase [Planctomycetota bacterium]